MKNLLDATVANQVKIRLGKLEPPFERRWGKMTAAQMLAHCSRLMRRLVKPMVLRNENPLRKNSPTAKSLIVGGRTRFGKGTGAVTRID